LVKTISLPRQAWGKHRKSLERHGVVVVLCRRLAQTFAKPTDPESVQREELMTMLLQVRNRSFLAMHPFYQDRLGTNTGKTQKGTVFLQCYAEAGPSGRLVTPLAGRPLSQPLVAALTAELRR
jgi:hypothetical protein